MVQICNLPRPFWMSLYNWTKIWGFIISTSVQKYDTIKSGKRQINVFEFQLPPYRVIIDSATNRLSVGKGSAVFDLKLDDFKDFSAKNLIFFIKMISITKNYKNAPQLDMIRVWEVFCASLF